MKYKKIVNLFMVLLMLLLSACGGKDDSQVGSDKVEIVCSIFPAYDWVRQVAGENSENINVTLLVQNGADMHSYQPSAADITRIIDADMVVYVGGTTETWITETLQQSTKENQIVINMMEILGERALDEEIVEGMQEEVHSYEAGENHEDDTHEIEAEADEHVWLSFANAELLCEEIGNALCELDNAGETLYRTNLETYTLQLKTLKESYEETAANASGNVLLYGDRFPFRYLLEEFDVEYYAAFPGCFAETEASFETIIFLAEKIDEYNLPAVIVIENSDVSIAETIIENTTEKNQEILVMDSMQSVTMEEIQNGATYLSIMEENRLVIEQTLN